MGKIHGKDWTFRDVLGAVFFLRGGGGGWGLESGGEVG